MEWVEAGRLGGPAFSLPRPGGLPVFVDPHGHRVRRLRHAARVVAGAAAVYLALLALGLAGPVAPPFSLFPGAKAGESGTEAVHSGPGGPASADRVQNASAGGSILGATGLPSTAPGAAGAPGSSPAPEVAPGPAGTVSPGQGTDGGTPAAAGQAPGSPGAAPAPSGGGGQPSGGGSGPRSTPPPSPSPSAGGPPAPAGSPGSSAHGNGPPAGHVPPGQAKKADAGPGNGNGNGPPVNHGQQMAAQHSQSPNH